MAYVLLLMIVVASVVRKVSTMNGLYFFILLIPAAFAVDCHVHGDGVFDLGCKAFVTCNNGVGVVTECSVDYVYNEYKKICDDPDNFSSLCTLKQNCTTKIDGRYADISTGCKTYYTCNRGTFFGHNYCIGGTVFNEALQICDWPVDTLPPCGYGKVTGHTGKK